MNRTWFQLLALAILDAPHKYTWSVQGFGMLRLYIRDIGRLHIWDSALRYPDVSMVHNHSWNLQSMVIAGKLRNIRFTESMHHTAPAQRPFIKQRLVTGYASKMVSDPYEVWLNQHVPERYVAGNVYTQVAAEIHLTDAEDGTVTLMARNEDVMGQADVYWPKGSSWGTATPRMATTAEIDGAVAKALLQLEKPS